MDKTKEYLAVLQKHHFWVICGVVVLASMISWYLANSKLDKEFNDQKTIVEGQFTAMNGVSSTQNHPNDEMVAKLRKMVLGVADNVYEAWKVRYNEQQKVPQWQGDLSKPFLDFVTTRPPNADIPRVFREEYMNFISKEIDTLFTQVNARDLVELENPMNAAANAPGGRPGIPGRGGVNEQVGVTHEWRGLVAWDETSRQSLRAQYDWSRVPTSQQVRYANEDLWIYRALLDIIRNTNKDAKEHLVATVKQIESLSIGALVPPPAMFYVPATSGAGGEGGMNPEGGGEGGMPEGGGEGLPPAAPGQGEGGEGGAPAAVNPDELVNAQLKHLRYVDAKGKPLSYSAPEPFAEFKIMPFEMRLVMDQRKIPDFLAHCANSPLPVEVRQVNIISTEAPPTGVAGIGGNMGGEGAMGGRLPGGMPMQGGRGFPGGEGMNMPGGRMGGLPGGEGMMPMGRNRPQPGMRGEGGAGGAADLGGSLEMRPIDLHVEIRGVIYIFNLPDRSKVGKELPSPEAAVPAAAPVEAGAGG